MVQNPVIPEDADKILFAEDFLIFMSRKNPKPYVCQNESYRAHVRNAFNESIKDAVRIMDAAMADHPLLKTMSARNTDEFTTEMYETIVGDFHEFYFPYGFRIDNLLKFCVPVAALAMHFGYNGVPEAPKLAIKFICDALQNYDMANGGWEIVNSKAEEYIRQEEDES